jgi:hypothetical protein
MYPPIARFHGPVPGAAPKEMWIWLSCFGMLMFVAAGIVACFEWGGIWSARRDNDALRSMYEKV